MKKTSNNNLNRGIQFYWSQKEPSNAKSLYDEFCKDQNVIWDPFLGAGSSLYGIRDTNLSFIGTEINEFPFKIVKFNIKEINKNRIKKIKDEFLCLIKKIGNPYIFDYKNEQFEIKKVSFDISDSGLPQIKKISLTDTKITNSEIAKNHYEKLWINKKKETKIIGQDLKLVKNSRLAIKKGMWLSDIFSPINFSLLKKISKEDISDDLKFIISSTLHLCRLTDQKSQSQFPYWVPKKNIIDRNIILLIDKKISQLNKIIGTSAIEESVNYESLSQDKKPNCLLFNKPIQLITNDDFPDNSIDFVITDPPYFDQVAYSEYSIIWEYFLGYKSNIEDEIVVSQRENGLKNEKYYFDQIKKSFSIIHSKMKLSKNMALYFKDSRIDKTIMFLTLLEEIGFQLCEQRFIPKKKYTYKQNNSSKSTLNGETVFILKKTNNKNNKIKEIAEESYYSLILKYCNIFYKNNGPFHINQILSSGLFLKLIRYKNSQSLKSLKQLSNIIEKRYSYNAESRLYEEKNK